eukprot:2796373-Pleurochrysis_carterae.AAC.1
MALCALIALRVPCIDISVGRSWDAKCCLETEIRRTNAAPCAAGPTISEGASRCAGVCYGCCHALRCDATPCITAPLAVMNLASRSSSRQAGGKVSSFRSATAR